MLSYLVLWILKRKWENSLLLDYCFKMEMRGKPLSLSSGVLERITYHSRKIATTQIDADLVLVEHISSNTGDNGTESRPVETCGLERNPDGSMRHQAWP